MFTFPVLSDDEIKNMNLLPEGMYQFKVHGVESSTADGKQLVSKSGNQMIKITLKVLDATGRERLITDYLVALESMVFKIKHFCESLGLDYNKGSFQPNACLGMKGKLQLVIQKGKKKDNSEEYYSDKNSVKDYVPKENADSKPKDAKDEFNDDIPW